MDTSIIIALILGMAVIITGLLAAVIIRSGRSKTIVVEKPRTRETDTMVEPEPAKKEPTVLARLLIRDEKGFQTDYHLKNDVCTIGREEGNQIKLNEPITSRNHAIIRKQLKDGVVTFTLADTNSKLGTFVNGKKILQKHELKDGDIIETGKTQMRFVSWVVPPKE